MNFRWIAYRCKQCKKIQWFDSEPKFTMCFPCMFILDRKLKAEGK